jgi:hypothetical protein
MGGYSQNEAEQVMQVTGPGSCGGYTSYASYRFIIIHIYIYICIYIFVNSYKK